MTKIKINLDNEIHYQTDKIHDEFKYNNIFQVFWGWVWDIKICINNSER